MAVTTSNLVNTSVSKLSDLKRVWLERIALSVLGHLGDDIARVTELAHFARAPSVETSSLLAGILVALDEEFVLFFGYKPINLLLIL